MRVKEAVTKVNMTLAPRFARRLARGLRPLELFAARICCLKYQLELPAEEARTIQELIIDTFKNPFLHRKKLCKGENRAQDAIYNKGRHFLHFSQKHWNFFFPKTEAYFVANVNYIGTTCSLFLTLFQIAFRISFIRKQYTAGLTEALIIITVLRPLRW